MPSDDSVLSWLRLPGTRESFEVFRRFVLEQARVACLPENSQTRVDLVLEEVLLNVLHYACTVSQAKQVAVGCGLIQEKGFLVRVTDPGPPFNPLEQPKPDTTLSIEERQVGGLGIQLAKDISSEMIYHRRQDHNILDIYF